MRHRLIILFSSQDYFQMCYTFYPKRVKICCLPILHFSFPNFETDFLYSAYHLSHFIEWCSLVICLRQYGCSTSIIVFKQVVQCLSFVINQYSINPFSFYYQHFLRIINSIFLSTMSHLNYLQTSSLQSCHFFHLLMINGNSIDCLCLEIYSSIILHFEVIQWMHLSLLLYPTFQYMIVYYESHYLCNYFLLLRSLFIMAVNNSLTLHFIL